MPTATAAVATAKTKFWETCRARLISQRPSRPALPRVRESPMRLLETRSAATCKRTRLSRIWRSSNRRRAPRHCWYGTTSKNDPSSRAAGKSAPADSEVALPVALPATSRIKPRGSLSLALLLARYCDAASVAAGPQPREFVARRRRPRRVRQCSMSPANFEAEKTVEHGVHLLRDHERAEMPRADRPGDHQPPT